jgi:hypothetical protein
MIFVPAGKNHDALSEFIGIGMYTMCSLDSDNIRAKLVLKASTHWLTCKAADVYNGSA